jgi:hypothetical protein
MYMTRWLVILMTSTLMQCAVITVNKNVQNHQVVFKRIGNYAANGHYHHVRIPVNLSKILDSPTEALQHMKTYAKEVYEQSLRYYRYERRGNMLDKHQAHLAATLVKETSDNILNTSTDQLSAIKNNLLSITSTLPESNTRPEGQLDLLFGIGAALFSQYNYINTQADTAQITRNTNSIISLTNIAEIQEEHLKHLEIEMASNRYFYLQNLKFNPALLVSASQDITLKGCSHIFRTLPIVVIWIS